jgi:UDP-N-acetylglucosamine--dolichyl-phosphate N-acetylglucosaminephosphotransferase
LFGTYVAILYFKPKLVKYGYVVEDKYKKNKRKMPTMGGIPMFVGVIASLALTQLLVRNEMVGKLFIFYFIVTVYTLYGVVDDLFSFRQRYDKILILLVLSLPIASLINNNSITFLGYTLYLNLLIPCLIAPIYIMVVANLINVHSGFNGLATGLSLIMLVFAGIKSYMLYGTQNLIFLLPTVGALFAFLPYNFYPAKLHEGNSGAFLTGSCLGVFLMMNNMKVFGIIILMPHIINFLMDTYTLKIKKKPLVKFGKVRKDGTIEAPPSMKFVSLKFFVTHYFRLNEKQAVLMLYSFTIICGLIGLVIA